MKLENKDVANYYDSFKHHQSKLGIHVRHRTIFKNLKKQGLKTNSNVLEIGCGIGTVSNLILSYLKEGQFVGVDISTESIEIAKNLNKKFKNSEFIVSDMGGFKHELKFDFVVLPDVIEHIPVEDHRALFKTISELSHTGTVILINIPEPYTLDWTRRNTPEKLQIIDQSLSMKELCNNVYPHGFYLYSITPYGLHYKHEEYLSIVFKRDFRRENVEPRSKIQEGFISLFARLWY